MCRRKKEFVTTSTASCAGGCSEKQERARIEKHVFAAPSDGPLEAHAARGLAELAAPQIGVISAARERKERSCVTLEIRARGGKALRRCFSARRRQRPASRFFHDNFDLGARDLERINGYARELVGLPLGDMRAQIQHELSRERAQRDELYRRALELGAQGTGEERHELVVEGALLCLQHREFAQDAGRMRGLLQMLEDKARSSRVTRTDARFRRTGP